jgi:glycosyltransferase involved in cell wall biosynthesis
MRDLTLPRESASKRSGNPLRLVVAGHDLKFMDLLLPKLRSSYEVKIDQWRTHTEHDVEKSEQLLDWADVVWGEWLLGAALWYAERIEPRQRLVVRAHRSEWGVAYGERIDVDKVDAFVTVSPHCRADFIDRFDLPADRTWMVPNALDVGGYRRGGDPARVYSLAMVGAVPKLKGLHRALKLLAQLREVDPRYTLTIYGKAPEQLTWLTKIADEMDYFASCRELVADLDLEDAVTWAGWTDTRDALADHGFVLSLSELEGFHIAPGEAFCAGGIGLFLGWRGSRELYPRELVFADGAELRDALVVLRDPERFQSAQRLGEEWVRRYYDIEVVWRRIESMLSIIGA